MLAARGRWDIASATQLEAELDDLPGDGRPITLDLSGVEALDTVGAWLVQQAAGRRRDAGGAFDIEGASEAQLGLLEQVRPALRPLPAASGEGPRLRAAVARLGGATLAGLGQIQGFVGFLGLVTTTLLGSLLHPSRLRLTSLVFHMQAAGLSAIPIVGLISFLIGVVLAYQGAVQLRQFGAEIFVVDLIALSVLRELGVLLTAIVVAGRSGSAFTAQIGSMKLREEVDAMRTLGIDPVEALVLPRLLALVVTLPLLAFLAGMAGLTGGALMAWAALDISPAIFVERLSAISVWHYLVGIIKAPFFALIVALVGCYEGMQVGGSAESVGRHTTRAVVESIFLVIIADAVFSIFFNFVGV